MKHPEFEAGKKVKFSHPDYEFDDIAEYIFYPIYDVIAEDLLDVSGVTEGKLLDIGCGGGHLGFAVMEKTKLYGYFADINKTAIQCAKERGEQRGFKERSEYFVADVEALPFEDNRFDLIVSRGSMLFWENQRKAFSEICRVLSPGGRTYIGGGLGRTKQRKEIMQKMHEYGLMCMADHPELSKALSNGEYQRMLPEFGCDCEIIDDEERGRWLVISKPVKCRVAGGTA